MEPQPVSTDQTIASTGSTGGVQPWLRVSSKVTFRLLVGTLHRTGGRAQQDPQGPPTTNQGQRRL